MLVSKLSHRNKIEVKKFIKIKISNKYFKD